jgi:hypothetical protein
MLIFFNKVKNEKIDSTGLLHCPVDDGLWRRRIFCNQQQHRHGLFSPP